MRWQLLQNRKIKKKEFIMKIISVRENEAGQRLDKLLAKYLNKAPKSFLYKMLRKKNIVLNGKKATGSEKLSTGDEIKLFLSEETIAGFSELKVQRAKTKLDIVYEDDHILLINKPSGMLSQKASDGDVSLVEYLTTYLLDSGQLTEEDLKSFRPGVCNRLDRNTSGLVVAGKSLLGLQTMAEALKNRSMHKYYRCLVDGVLDSPCHISGYLKKNEKTNQVQVEQTPSEGALPIQTEYVPIRRYGAASYLEVKLITGRSHQIRAHLASIGHPIIGDYKYGSRRVNDQYQRALGLNSQLLHAYRLEMPELTGPLSYLSGQVFTAAEPLVFARACAFAEGIER